MRKASLLTLTHAALLATTALVAAPAFGADTQMPDGKFITPTALAGSNQQLLNPGLPAYPNFVAGQALREQLSPDGKTLAIICAGQNSLDDANGNLDVANSTQYLFLFDVSGANKATPALKQVIKQTNAYVGLVWSPDGSTIYAAGGADDAVYVYTQTNGVFAQTSKISLGHIAVSSLLQGGLGGAVRPNAGSLAISVDGRTLVVANNYNDSISVIDTASGTVRYEHDLRPWFATNEGTSGVAGGEYPYAVVLRGTTAYVSSARDRQVVAVDISSPLNGRLVARIPVNGNALGMTLNAAGTTLYVAQDNADQVAVINTATNTVTATIDTRAPAPMISGILQRGAAPMSVRLSPNGRMLYAVNSGANSIAVINVRTQRVMGLIPTAYEPTDVAFSVDGAQVYIINGKNATGPNPQHLTGYTPYLTQTTYPGGNAAAAAAARASNQYQFQLERSSLVSAPVPTMADLPPLTNLVVQNNGYFARSEPSDVSTMRFLRDHINHVIYIVKENRTFDQILGDLTNGAQVDPSLAVFGAPITPNFHALAQQFVTIDNLRDPGDGSMDGWSWSMQGRITETQGITQQINYAFVNRGLSYESEGTNRNIPVGLPSAGRDAATTGLFSAVGAALPGGAANLLPGIANHTAGDTPLGKQAGYIWDAALGALKTVRNYGWFNANLPTTTDSSGNPIVYPYAAGVPQVVNLSPTLGAAATDVYFRGFDMNVPDLWRYYEWKREFDQFVANGNLPNLSMVRMAHDHMGSFGSAYAGINTPETQQADNDLSVALMIQAVANSPYAQSTLFIITEDDCQDGPDHVDSHRATAYMVGAYVKKGGAVVDTRYSQVNVLRTIEDILGTTHLNLNTMYARPMADVFDIRPSNAAWTFTAVASTVLKGTGLVADNQAPASVQFAAGPDVTSTHDAAYWARETDGFDFSDADRAPTRLFNEILWSGIKGNVAYPKAPAASGKLAKN